MKTDIQYSVTFQRITPESAEHGEAESRGFVSLNIRAPEDEMADVLDGTEPSQWPLTPGAWLSVWFTRYGERDVADGSYTNYGFHPATEQDAERMIALWLDLHQSE